MNQAEQRTSLGRLGSAGSNEMAALADLREPGDDEFGVELWGGRRDESLLGSEVDEATGASGYARAEGGRPPAASPAPR